MLVAKRSRMTSIRLATSVSVSASTGTVADTVSNSGRVISGRTSTSATNSIRSPSSSLVISTSGSLSGISLLASIAEL